MTSTRGWSLGLLVLSLVLPLFAPLAAGRASARPGAEDPAAPDAVTLFRAHCASCHGETGDGQGTTTLDRPARSFRDGGFSFGNTPEALYRTITTGIPGTPMPGFESALRPEERRALAAHVVKLGPAIQPPPLAAVLQVTTRPLVVRGLLPGLADGESPLPRGLLLGLRDGTSFEYRADDVSLRAVRFGAFVERRDWGGRGGTALKPLGALIERVPPERGIFERVTEVGNARLARRLAATEVRGDAALVAYRLVEGASSVLAEVEEAPSAKLVSGTVELVRVLSIRNGAQRWRLRIRHAGATATLASGTAAALSGEATELDLEPGAVRELSLFSRAPAEIRAPEPAAQASR